MKTYYFISGLPRSGSTLLSAILKQNPEFYADIASPVSGLFEGMINSFTGSENSQNIDEERRKDSLLGFADGYYKNIDRQVIFDSSRAWTSKTSLLKTLFPNPKIICCVRDVQWVLDSFERIANHNCLSTNTLVDDEARPSVETRCMNMMDPTKGGQVYKPLKHLEEGLAANPDIIHLVEYDDLCKSPEQTMKKIYNFLNIEYFPHDYDNVEYMNEPFDLSFGMRDLHTVRKKVEYKPRNTILPQIVWDKYKGLEFWRDKSQLMYG